MGCEADALTNTGYLYLANEHSVALLLEEKNIDKNY